MAAIGDIEGIGESYANKLKEAGVATVESLLEKGATPKGRADIAETTGIREDLILRWVNHADLYRIKGIGSELSELLEKAGVDTVPELARRNPDNLHAKLVEINEAKNLVRRMPSLSQVQSWVEQAKELPRVVTH